MSGKEIISNRKNIKLSIEYDGTNYHGWQIQPNRITIQGLLKDTLETILQEKIKLIGASRTDAGVHAKGQIANFHTFSSIELDKIHKKLNQLLPEDIRITTIEYVNENFNSRKDCISKTYKYNILNKEISSPFFRNYALHIKEHINLNLLNQLSKDIIGENNFFSFTGQRAANNTSERRVFDAFWGQESDFYFFSITASGFLKYMVRRVVGAMLAVNSGRENHNFISLLLNVQDRRRSKYCAPPHGLFLEKVDY